MNEAVLSRTTASADGKPVAASTGLRVSPAGPPDRICGKNPQLNSFNPVFAAAKLYAARWLVAGYYSCIAYAKDLKLTHNPVAKSLAGIALGTVFTYVEVVAAVLVHYLFGYGPHQRALGYQITH